MTESLISEWLADWADVSPSELQSFANTLSQDTEIVRALYVLLEERGKYCQLVDTVCNQLYNFYRSQETELQRFTLQFLPTLIYIYLNAAAHGDIKNCRSVETLLIALYNLEIVDKSGQQKSVSFRLPSLAMLSIYHEPASLTPASLTESAVRRFEECNSKLVSWGPLQQVVTLNAQNRLKIMTALLFIYNQQLGHVNKFALEQLCKVATKLVTQGFTKPGHHQRSSYGSESSFVPRLLPRIPVSSQFLLEFLHAVYFAMYNDCCYLATQAVEDIHNRACYEGYPDVMLVTNAIRNSANSGAAGQPSDGPIGISVALSPATATATISKSMITNASFRTKKLPDDLDEELFMTDETNGTHVEKHQSMGSGNTKRHAWHWKHALTSTLDDENVSVRKVHASSSLEGSRRESASSSQNSPVKSSPKKIKDHQSKKTTAESDEDYLAQRIRKNQKDKSDGDYNENRLSAGSRLYSVLEEQALGEAIRGSLENLYMESNKAINFCTTPTLSTNTWYYWFTLNTVGSQNSLFHQCSSAIHDSAPVDVSPVQTISADHDDIPIQVAKEESGGEGKGNLVSITEEQEGGGEPTRVGSSRQSKDQKTASKIANFPVLGKKPREKDSKVTKNAHVTASEKEKKLGGQTTSKENIKGSSSMLNSEPTEIDGNVNGCTIRKKNSNVENNSVAVDTNTSLIDGERLVLSGDPVDNTNIETPINLRSHGEATEPLTSSIQVSSV